METVWGETIRNIGVITVMALAVLSMSAMAQLTDGQIGTSGTDILGTGIFETNGAAITFPEAQDTNIDTMVVGNDKAIAFGNVWQETGMATAANDLEIKKNQDTGECEWCYETEDTASGGDTDNYSGCKDPCIKVNVDQITVGNREARAYGFSSATNHIKIVANQQ